MAEERNLALELVGLCLTMDTSFAAGLSVKGLGDLFREIKSKVSEQGAFDRWAMDLLKLYLPHKPELASKEQVIAAYEALRNEVKQIKAF